MKINREGDGTLGTLRQFCSYYFIHIECLKNAWQVFYERRFSILLLHRSSSYVLMCNSVKHIDPMMTLKTYHQHKSSIKLLTAILISRRVGGEEESTSKVFLLLESLALSPWKTGHIDKKHFDSLKSKPLCLCLYYIMMIPSQWPSCKFCLLPITPSNFTTAPHYNSERRDRSANNKWKTNAEN